MTSGREIECWWPGYSADYPPEHALIAAEPYYSWLLRIKIVHTPLKLRMPLYSACMAPLLYRDVLLLAMYIQVFGDMVYT